MAQYCSSFSFGAMEAGEEIGVANYELRIRIRTSRRTRMRELLQGKRVRLTALTAEDLPTMRPWFQDAEFMRLFDAQAAIPKGRGGWRSVQYHAEATDGYYFAIRRVEDDALIGYIELDGILWPHQVAWFSIGMESAPVGDRARR
jgi:RimJ/RimL family protein N-acetyltransferase